MTADSKTFLRPLLLALSLTWATLLLGESPSASVPHEGPTSWSAGIYKYDGAGNITDIGTESFFYDKLSRLRSATIRGPDLSSLQTQTFLYDEYGNLTNTAKLGQPVALPTSTTTNRLQLLQYDESGNVTVAGTQHYSYDAAGMLNTVRLGTSQQPRIIYAYTADDERLFSFDVSTGITHWTLRGLDNKVLRDLKQDGTTWSVERDYVYRDGLLLAALKSTGAVEHYTLDHLGTPRLITDATGHKLGLHAYWPFGEEWSPGTAQEASPLKFTGHERDADVTGGTAPLDYMHARYYGAGWGRFLAVDPVLGDPDNPQGWNRYAYCADNPILKTDPDGRVAAVDDIVVGAVIIGTALFAEAVLQAPSGTPGRTNAQEIAAGIASIPGRVKTAVDGITPYLEGYRGGSTDPLPPEMYDYLIHKSEPTRGINPTDPVTSSRADRREAMRQVGIPTSQQPASQSSPRGPGNTPAGRQLMYPTPQGEKVVQHQLQDRNHGPHWEAGKPKPGGQVDPAGRPRLQNDKVKVPGEG